MSRTWKMISFHIPRILFPKMRKPNNVPKRRLELEPDRRYEGEKYIGGSTPENQFKLEFRV